MYVGDTINRQSREGTRYRSKFVQLQTDEDFLFVKFISDQSPECRAPTGEKQGHLVVFLTIPFQRKIVLQNFVAHKKNDGVHSWKDERFSGPPAAHVDDIVERRQEEESHWRQRQHEGQGPKILIHGDPTSVLTTSTKNRRDDATAGTPRGEST